MRKLGIYVGNPSIPISKVHYIFDWTFSLLVLLSFSLEITIFLSEIFGHFYHKKQINFSEECDFF